MSSRVQKGGTVFRPLAKQRARSSNTPNPSLSRTNSANVDHTPPPSTIPPSFSPSSQPLETSSNPTPVPFFNSQPTSLRTAPPIVSISSTLVPPPILLSQSPAAPVAPNSIITRPSAPPTLATSQASTVVATPISIPSVVRVPVASSSTSQTVSQTQNEPRNIPLVASGSQTLVEPTRSDEISGENAEVDSGSTSKSNNSGAEKKRTRKSQTRKEETLEETEEARPKRKRARKAKKEDDEGSAEDSDDSPAPKKRKGSTGKRGGRRGRSSSTPAFDPHAERGEDIDPTVVTMAALCEDTGQGRISSKAAEILNNHAAWKASNRERRARMKVAMERKKYGLPEEEEDRPTENPNPTATETPPEAEASASATSDAPQVQAETDPNGFDYSQNLTASRYNVQVRIGPNGETIIDEESLVVDRVEEEDTSNYTHVVESDTSKFVNSGTYGKRFRGSRWSAEETELFYDALSQYGENYELISYVLPGRDRKACKNKFKAEDKKNPGRINQCLNNRIPVDMATLSRMTGKDFSGPVPVIAAPAPLPTPNPQPVTQAPESSADSQRKTPSPTTHKTRKRSRSRTTTVDDGIQIIGDIDGFES
ncbi:hypothetical protein VKT23_005332 [Stygiomarasmius scandens]|uniref:Myb-like domain-containing protein n=1 Tax=Marasmiellus scandens TaxID=2682957 RepID=A0ABR1JPR6_9AGAR